MTHSVHTFNIDFKASVPFCFTTFKNVSLMNISEKRNFYSSFLIEKDINLYIPCTIKQNINFVQFFG